MSMIKPSGSGGVIIGSGSNLGMGNGQQQQQQQNPANMYRQFIEQGSASSNGGGGIQWERYGANGSIDQGLQDIINDSTTEVDATQILVASVSQANLWFINHILGRTGMFYEVYRHAVEGFRVSDITLKPCPVRDAFIKMFLKHQEFTKPVGLNASIMFGWDLICYKREKNTDDIPKNQYLRSAETAVRSILFMEMVQWLMKTSEGQQHARQLPSDLKAKMPKLEKFNAIVDTASAAFGVNNPYAGITFEVTSPVRNELAANRYENYASEKMYGNTESSGRGPYDHSNEMLRLDAMVTRNAKEYHDRQRGQSNYSAHDDNSYYTDNYAPAKPKRREDYENITFDNLREFKALEFFRCIGKANHYFISEHEWKLVQKAFKRHESQGREETVWGEAFRIVKIDLDANDGWTSTLVRSGKLSLMMVLTNPEKLLPLLDDPDQTGYYSVVVKTVEEVKAAKTLQIEIEEARLLEKCIPVIVFNEPIVSNKAVEIVNGVTSVAKRLTKNIDGVNAVCYNARVWDTFTCASKEDKERLFKDIPFLFKDNKETQPSFFMACKTLLSYFNAGRLDKEICQFIDSHLTQVINNYLVNSAGYPSYQHEAGFLSVDSIIEDYDELDEEFETNDPIMYGIFNNTDGNHYLSEALKIFTFEDDYLKRGETATAVERLRVEQELVVERPLHITSISNSDGPIYNDPNLPVIIKRSLFPEYFDLIERSFDKTMGEQSFDTTDKVLHFVSNGNMWLFSHSAIDKNVATLRHVNLNGTLVLLELD